MRVSLLGPLTVMTEDGERTPNGDMQRSAFALLALNAGNVVSADRLIEELWGGLAPANPTNSVQSHISQLRRLLGAERIVTRPPGYVLDLDPEAVDAVRFERLVVAARTGPSENAAETLREALALWRGPPLADVGDAPFIAIQSSRLEELRLAALEDRIDADLALGLHAGLVVELQTLVAEHQLRERLHGQLMIALYRCGRQADALRAVRQRARRSLPRSSVSVPDPICRGSKFPSSRRTQFLTRLCQPPVPLSSATRFRCVRVADHRRSPTAPTNRASAETATCPV